MPEVQVGKKERWDTDEQYGPDGIYTRVAPEVSGERRSLILRANRKGNKNTNALTFNTTDAHGPLDSKSRCSNSENPSVEQQKRFKRK